VHMCNIPVSRTRKNKYFLTFLYKYAHYKFNYATIMIDALDHCSLRNSRSKFGLISKILFEYQSFNFIAFHPILGEVHVAQACVCNNLHWPSAAERRRPCCFVMLEN
jgi:hypothetical protein